MIKAVGYVRVSTEKQLNNTSIDKQIEEIKKYCENNNLVLVDIYVEEAKSGSSFKGRDKFKEMYHRILKKEENIKYLIVYKQDRISRDSLDTLYIIKRLQSFDKHLISIADNVNTEDTASKILVHVLALVSELERSYILMRTGLGMEKRFEDGKFNGGRLYGYRSFNKKMHVDKEEAEIIKYIFDKYTNDGWGYRKIAHALNMEGISTLNDNAWTINAVKTILKNKFYAGYVKWRGQYKKGEHDAIISKELWEKTEKVRATRKYIPQKIHPGTFALSGILKCPRCSSSMLQGNSNQKYKYYQCSKNKNSGKKACSSNLVKKETIENSVLSKVFPFINSLILKPHLQSSIQSLLSEELFPIEERLKDIKDALKEINKRKGTSLDLFDEGIIDKSTLKERFQELKHEENKYLKLEQDLEKKLSQKNNSNLSIVIDWLK